MNWIHLVHSRIHRRVFVNTLTNNELWDPLKRRIFSWLAGLLSASQAGLYIMEFINVLSHAIIKHSRRMSFEEKIQLFSPLIVISLVYISASVVSWGTMLQAGRSRVRFQMRSLDFLIDLVLPAALWPCGRLSLWQKWLPRIFLGGTGRPARKADNLTTICELTV
jgi:hypothetical protein